MERSYDYPVSSIWDADDGPGRETEPLEDLRICVGDPPPLGGVLEAVVREDVNAVIGGPHVGGVVERVCLRGTGHDDVDRGEPVEQWCWRAGQRDDCTVCVA